MKICIFNCALLYVLALGPILPSYCITYKRGSGSSLDVSSSECPPGFANDTGECTTCAAPKYLGIWMCNNTAHRAYIIQGYWVGYCNDSTRTICTGHCLSGFCRYNGTKSTKGLQLLPAHASELDSSICGPTRTGTLCGNCRAKHSVYYHSWSYKCGPNHNCHLGIFFYILSELLPLTIFFITVMVCNISFTSGATTGFILFAQVVDSISVDADGIIPLPSLVFKVRLAQRFVYRLFNLDFFSIEQLSFCLWERATVQNVLVMKYVTIAFALALVLSAQFL